MAITSTALTNLTQSIFTSVGSSAITAMYFCNTGERPAHLTVHVTPKGVSAGATNIIYYQVPIAVKDTYICDTEKIILEDGDKISAKIDLDYYAGNTSIIATVSVIGI